MANIITEPRGGSVQQGEAFTYRLDLTGVEETYPRGFLDATITAEIMNSPQRNDTLWTSHLQALSVGDKSVDFVVPGNVTNDRARWVAGKQVAMQILLVVDGIPTQWNIFPMIYIGVKEGFINPRTTGIGTGSFGNDFGDSFNKGQS